MSTFSKELPLHSNGELGPVKIGSKVRPMVPLVRGEVEILPGCGWSDKTIIIEKELAEESKWLRIMVSMPAEVPLAHFVETILNKRPIALKVSLFPAMAMPGMGVPVPVEAAPVVDDVSITMPAIRRPEISLQAKFLAREADGKYRLKIVATLNLPPYISWVEKTSVLEGMSVAVTERKNAEVSIRGETPLNDGKEIELIVLPEIGPRQVAPSITVTAMVKLAGLNLRADKNVTLDVERKYLLNVHPASLGVTVKNPASLTVQVLEEMPSGERLLVSDAAITLSGGDGLVSLAPSEGWGRLLCKVTQPKIVDEKKTSLTISASAGPDKMPPQTVPVVLETAGGGRLEVVFDPPDKSSLNPYIKTDHIVLRARWLPENEGTVVPADITFEPQDPDGWLDGPREFGSTNAPSGGTAAPTADISTPLPKPDDEWKLAAFFGKVPTGSQNAAPPASEQVIVRATVRGRTADERPVPIGLLPKPSIVADKQELALLANGKRQAIGWSLATSPNDLSLVVMNGGDEEWKFTVSSDSDKVVVEERDRQPSVSVFRLTPKDNLPLPTTEAGNPTCEEVIEFATRATSGSGLVIDGPTISVTLCYEGIFIEQLYACDEGGRFYDVTKQGALPYRVFSPTEERSLSIDPDSLKQELLLPYVKLVAMVWNGNALERKNDLPIEAQTGSQPPSKAQESQDADARAAALWNFVCFHLRDSHPYYSGLDILPSGPEEIRNNAGKWHIIFLKQIPGNGETAKGHIRFVVGLPDAGLYPDFGCDVPIHLHLGKSRKLGGGLNVLEEGARCRHIIDECFPPEYRERLWDDLERLPGKSAKDYRNFAQDLCKRAWEAWAVDQKDFLSWESGWGSWFYMGAVAAKWVGDVSFMLLVGFATSELGPMNAYFTSVVISAWKDEALAFYEYYLQHGGSKLPHESAVEFVNERLTTFLISLTAGAVDMVILHGFDLKNPSTYKLLAWLWIWKFEQRLAEKLGDGYIDAMIEAGKEVLAVPVMLGLQEYVNKHGSKSLMELWNSKVKQAEAKGAGGKVEKSAKEKKEGEKLGKEPSDQKEKKGDKEKPAKEKAAEKEQYDKGKKEQKDKAKGEAETAINNSKGEAPAFERKAFEQGRAEGRRKLEELNKAAEELAKNPNDPEARRKFSEAAEKVQQDKHAMHELNNQNPDKPDSTREQFNEFWKGRYDKVDRTAKQRIAEELNHNLKPGEKPYTADDIELAAVTNTPPKSPREDSVKSTYDRDVTYRDKRTGEDIKSEISERIYNEEFYKQMHQGRSPASPEEAREYAERCDQTVTDRFHKDAYGGGKVDIPPAVDPFYKGQSFKDVGATAKAMEYKVQEWYQRADHAAERGDHAAASAYKEEGMRQLTKQFKNQVEARIDKINEIMGYPNPPTARVPENLRAAVEVMNKVGSTQENGRLFTPADAEAALNKMGTSPKQVISQMSGVVESLQRNAPPQVRDAVEEHVRGLSDEAAAAYREQQRLNALKQALKSKHKG